MRRGSRGWTPIELLVLLAVMGVLSTVAIPRYLRHKCRARQDEAVAMLRAISTVQRAYHGEHGTYLTMTELTAFGGLDPQSVSGTSHYVLTTSDVSREGWSAQAQDGKRGISVRSGADVWHMASTDKVPINVLNRCR